MTRFIFFVVASLATTSAFAQITITMADYQGLVGSTHSIQTYVSTNTTGLQNIINNSGANKTWNVTGRTYQSSPTATVTYLDYPGGAPLANDPAFTTSNLVSRHGPTVSSTILWYFCKLDETGFYGNGYVFDTGGLYDKGTNSPAYLSYQFPLTFNSHWTGSTYITFTTSSGAVSHSTLTYDHFVDSYGTISTPEGSFQCLRLKSKFTTSITISGITYTSIYYYYYFFDQKKNYTLIGADSNNVPVGSVIYYRTSITSSIKELLGILPEHFELFQNNPNPFNPSTMIRFQLPKESFVTLKVHNILGQEVQTLVNEVRQAGRYEAVFDGSRLSSGVYFYRLQTVSFSEIKKLLLIK